MPDQWTMGNLRRAAETYPLRGPVLDVGAGDFASWMRPVFVDRGLAYFALDQRAAEVTCMPDEKTSVSRRGFLGILGAGTAAAAFPGAAMAAVATATAVVKTSHEPVADDVAADETEPLERPFNRASRYVYFMGADWPKQTI